jgi:hypothetical protein
MYDYKVAKKGINKFEDWEFNDITEELKNPLKCAGIDFDEHDKSQLTKSIYKVAHLEFSVSGVNQVTLTPPNNCLPFEDYYDGMVVGFVPSNDNSDEVKVKVGSLPEVPVANSGVGDFLANVPTMLVYGNGEFHIIPTNRYNNDGLTIGNPIESKTYDRPANATEGMYWKKPDGTLWYNAGNDGDIPVSLDGTQPAGLKDGDKWLDASSMPPKKITVGDPTDERYNGLTPNNALESPDENRPHDIEAGQFWKDVDGKLWYYDGEDDIPVSLDGLEPIGNGGDWLDASKAPYEVNRHGEPSGDGDLANPYNREPSDEFKKPNKYWIDCNGQLMTVDRFGNEIPVSLDGDVPSGLKDGDKYLDASMTPPQLVVVGGQNIHGSTPEDAIQSNDNNVPPEIANQDGAYWTSSDGQLMVTTDCNGNSLPVSLDCNEVPKNADGSDLDGSNGDKWFNEGVYPPTIMVWDDKDDDWKSENIKVDKTEYIDAPTKIGEDNSGDNGNNFANTNWGIISLDGSELPDKIYSPEILDYGTLLHLTDIQNEREVQGRLSGDILRYKDSNSNEKYRKYSPKKFDDYQTLNVELDKEYDNDYSTYGVRGLKGNILINKQYDTYTPIAHVTYDYSTIYLNNFGTEINTFGLFAASPTPQTKTWTGVDLSMFSNKSLLSRFQFTNEYSVILYDGKLYATGRNFTDKIKGFYHTDTSKKIDTFEDVTPDSNYYVNAQISSNDTIMILDDNCKLRYIKQDPRPYYPPTWEEYPTDVWDILDGNWIVEKNTDNLVLKCEDGSFVNVGVRILRDRNRIYGEFGNVVNKVILARLASNDGYYSFVDKTILPDSIFDELINEYFPYVNKNDIGFVRVIAVLTDILWTAIKQLKRNEIISVTRIIKYDGKDKVVGLIARKDNSELVSYIQDVELKDESDRKVRSLDEIVKFDNSMVKMKNFILLSQAKGLLDVN